MSAYSDTLIVKFPDTLQGPTGPTGPAGTTNLQKTYLCYTSGTFTDSAALTFDGFGWTWTSSWFNPLNSTQIPGDIGTITLTLSTAASDYFLVCTSRSGVSNFNNHIYFGIGAAVYEALMRVPLLSSAGTPYLVRAGWHNGAALDLHGVFFRYTHSGSSGNWECVCKNGGVESGSPDSGILVAINTTYRLRIEVNEAGTEAKFYINGSLVKTITANIPSAANLVHGQFLLFRPSVGASNSTVLLGHLYMSIVYP